MNYCRKLAPLIITFLIALNLSATSVRDCFDDQKVVISNMAPFLKAIENAQDFLYLGAYKLHANQLPQETLTKALKASAERKSLTGNILVLLESNLTTEEKKEEKAEVKEGDSQKTYESLGIQVVPGYPAFNATHFKVLITGGYAFVGTTNFDKDFQDGDILTRDFSCIIRNPKLIQELKEVFLDDVQRRKPQLVSYHVNDLKNGDTLLTWGPEQHRQHLRELLESASHTIEIYQQALQDDDITNQLVAAIHRGVTVSVLMSKFPFGEKHGNKSEKNQQKLVNTQSHKGRGEVRLTGDLIQGGEMNGQHLHIHAKVVIVDGKAMYLGSANFYAPALDKDRNVGIITLDSEYIIPVWNQFMKDWQASSKAQLQ